MEIKTLYEQIVKGEGNEYAQLTADTLKDALEDKEVDLKVRLQALSILVKLESSYTDSKTKHKKYAEVVDSSAITIDAIESRIALFKEKEKNTCQN